MDCQNMILSHDLKNIKQNRWQLNLPDKSRQQNVKKLFIWFAQGKAKKKCLTNGQNENIQWQI